MFQNLYQITCHGTKEMVDILIDQRKRQYFQRDTDKHFKEAKIINFDIIYKEIRGEVVPPDLLKFYQTVNEKKLSQYIRLSVFRTGRKSIYFE